MDNWNSVRAVHRRLVERIADKREFVRDSRGYDDASYAEEIADYDSDIAEIAEELAAALTAALDG